MSEEKAKKSEEKRPTKPAADASITVKRSELVAAFGLWRADDAAGKCVAIDHPEKGAQADADALLGYVRVATA